VTTEQLMSLHSVNYVNLSSGLRQRISYKVAVITYKTRSTSKPAYLSDLLQDYRPARTLRSSDKLLLSVPRMALAFSANAFSVSAPSVWNSLSYQCRSAELFSSFRHILTRSSAVAERLCDASCHWIFC